MVEGSFSNHPYSIFSSARGSIIKNIENIYWLSTACEWGYNENDIKEPYNLSNAQKMSEEEMKSEIFIQELNRNAKIIKGACGWKKGKNGFPILDIIDEDNEVGSIGSITIDNEKDGLTQYFDINGRPVRNPQHGIFIKIHGGKYEKIIL